MLTAAHELRRTVEYNIPLYLSVSAIGVLPFSLADARFHSTEEDGRDVAAIWLPPDMAKEIGKHKVFLGHNQINCEPTKRRTPYVFFGYPMTWSAQVVAENTVLSRALVFTTFEHEGPRHATAFYDPAVHLLLNFTRDAINLVDDRVDTLPKLHGISGCGIWQVGDRCDRGLNSRTAESLTLVGIQHRWFPHYDYIQATRIGFAIDLIAANYPETRAAMSLIYPSTVCTR